MIFIFFEKIFIFFKKSKFGRKKGRENGRREDGFTIYDLRSFVE